MKKTKTEPPGVLFPDKNPLTLFRTFLLLSVVSSLAMLVFAGLVGYLLPGNHIIREVKSDSLKIARLIYSREKGLFVSTDKAGVYRLNVEESSFQELDRRMKQYLEQMGLFSITIYDTAGKIIYSTVHGMAGKSIRDFTDIAGALRDNVTAHIMKKSRIMNIAGKEMRDAVITATFIPIHGEMGIISGVFEIDSDVTEAYGALSGIIRTAMICFMLILLIVFGVLVILMKKSTRRLVGLKEELDNLTMMDALTSAYKKEHVIERGEAEYIRVRREESKECLSSNLSVILVDIDRFREINRSGGRMAGDVVLRDVSERLRSAIRKYDVLGRYGGEEFIVLLPNSDFEDAFHIAQRVWKKIREMDFRYGDRTYSLTVSIGVASSRDEDNEFSEILERSQKGLDEAKAHGADRIESI